MDGLNQQFDSKLPHMLLAWPRPRQLQLRWICILYIVANLILEHAVVETAVDVIVDGRENLEGWKRNLGLI